MADITATDNLVNKYIKGIQDFYPGFEFSSSSGFDSMAYELEVAFNDKTISNTDYELKNDNFIIHYSSSIQNVLEILYSGNLRLKNLSALNDPQEIDFLLNHLKLETYKAYTENFKSTYFSASFCKIENYSEADKFPMWRLYGGDGYGCAIVFELEKHDSYWNNFMIAKIQYGKCESIKRFDDFMKFHISFKKEHNFPMNVPITFPALMAFHKNEIWEYENEIRLITHQNYDEYSLKCISDAICELKHSIDKNNKRYSYVELPLKGSNRYNEIAKRGFTETFYKLLPTLRIKKIVLGYRLDSKLLFDIQRTIGYIANNIYGYKIEVENSRLREFMI